MYAPVLIAASATVVGVDVVGTPRTHGIRRGDIDGPYKCCTSVRKGAWVQFSCRARPPEGENACTWRVLVMTLHAVRRGPLKWHPCIAGAGHDGFPPADSRGIVVDSVEEGWGGRNVEHEEWAQIVPKA